MAFDPTTLFPGAAGDREGEVFEIRPENLWQDKAGTVAVTTHLDPVKRIDGISVNGHYLVMMGTNESLTYHTDGTVHWLTGAGGVWDIMWSDGNSWGFMNGNPYAVGVAVSLDSPSAGDQYFFGTMPAAGSSRGNSVVHLGARTGTTATIAHWSNDQDFTHTFPTASAERHICEYFNPGSEYTVDGTQIDVSATTPSALDEVGNITIFGRNDDESPDAANGMDGDIYGMIVVIDTLTAQEKADIDEWLQEQIEGPSGQTINVGKAIETDTALALALAQTVNVGLAVETDTANAVAADKALSVGLASETDTANAATPVRTTAVGLASETDTANAITGAKTELVLQAAEEDIARAVTAVLGLTVGKATETSSALSITHARAVTVGKASETSAATLVGRLRVLGLGKATETDSASLVAPLRALVLGIASETDTANALEHSRQVSVGVATESDTANSVTITGGVEPEPTGGYWWLRRRRRWI